MSCAARFKLSEIYPLNFGRPATLYGNGLWDCCFFMQMVSIGQHCDGVIIRRSVSLYFGRADRVWIGNDGTMQRYVPNCQCVWVLDFSVHDRGHSDSVLYFSSLRTGISTRMQIILRFLV